MAGMKLVSLVVTLALALTPAFAQAEKKAADAKKKADTKVEEVKKKTTDTKTAVEAKTTDVKKKADEKKTVAKKAPAAPVNINTASKSALMELPGVGEANADHIIKGRPYKSVDDLITKKVVQQRYFDEFKSMITVK